MNNTELQTYLCEYKNALQRLKDEKKASLVASSKVEIDEENSNKVLVYVGTYKVDKFVTKAIEVLTYDNDPKAKYKRYIDVETGHQYNVNMDTVNEFEASHDIVYREVVMNNIMLHYQNFSDVRREFFEGITKDSQENVVLKLINSSEK